MDAVRVPQNLELQDVIAWGLGATDLVCVVVGAVIAWWLYLTLPGDPVLRALAACPIAIVAAAVGLVRVGELPLRGWLLTVAAFALRRRLFVSGVES